MSDQKSDMNANDGELDAAESRKDASQGGAAGDEANAHHGHKTSAGQEAVNNAPRDHSHEHQSQYGGGGTNGGAKKT
jgi:hypothetical protein